MKFQYFKIVKDRQEYLGNRYFKWDWSSQSIVQVVLNSGQPKRGRSGNVGIYIISTTTFATNYMAMGYVEPTTKKKFESECVKVYALLVGVK